MVRSSLFLVCLLTLAGCRSTNGDRLPATAVDNPDPIFGSATKLRTQDDKQLPAVASKDAVKGTTTGQPNNSDRIGPEQIGPLAFQPRSVTPDASKVPAGVTPGQANLAHGIKTQAVEPIRDPQIQPVSNTLPASSPEVVADYRNRMNRFSVVGLRTKALANGSWEAVGHFPVENQPNQLRRIEAQGVTEADALLAILEQLEKPQ